MAKAILLFVSNPRAKARSNPSLANRVTSIYGKDINQFLTKIPEWNLKVRTKYSSVSALKPASLIN